MNTAFSKLMTAHKPVNGAIAISQRVCRFAGLAGMKF